MEKIKLSIFDVFAYILPGSVILVATIFSFSKTINNIDSIIDYSNKFTSFSSGILLLLFSYIIGFINHSFGSLIGKCIKVDVPDSIRNQEPKYNSDKFILVREFSPTNFYYIELWKTLNSFCNSLITAFIVSIILICHKASISSLDWRHAVCICIVLIISIICLAIRSKSYANWAYWERHNTIKLFDLYNERTTFFKSKIGK